MGNGLSFNFHMHNYVLQDIVYVILLIYNMFVFVVVAVCMYVYTTSSLPPKSAGSFASAANGNVTRRRNIAIWIAIVDLAEKFPECDWLVFLTTLVGEGGIVEGGLVSELGLKPNRQSED